MSKKIWTVFSIGQIVLMIAIICGSVVSGGCSGMIETAAGGTVPMKCHWTFVAIPFVAALGAIMGAVGCTCTSKDGRRACALATLLAGIVIALLPTSFGIGLCANADMHCHTTALIVWIIAAVAIVLSLVQLVKADPKAAEQPKMQL